MKVEQYIKELRLSKGLSQEELGKIIGVQRAAVQKWESGVVQNLKRITIKKLADFFSVDPANFIVDDVPIKENIKILTPREEMHINKYRKLDDQGKDVVDFITNRELEKHYDVLTPSFIAASDGIKPDAMPITEDKLIKIDIQADNE